MESTRIIRTYLWLSGLFTLSASMIWGINTLFLLNAGLDIFQVFVVNGVFTLGSVLFEIPTGVVADTLGRRVSFLISTVVLTFGTLAYVWASTTEMALVHFIWVSLLLALGYTFHSGAVEAWLVDALHFTGYDKELESVFSQAAAINGVGMIFGSIAGGFLGTLSLSIPYLLRATFFVLAGLVGIFAMRDLGYEKKPLTAKNTHAHHGQHPEGFCEIWFRKHIP